MKTVQKVWLSGIARSTALYFTLGACLLGVSPVAKAERTLLRFGRLIDGTGEILAGREILVEEGSIAAIGNDIAKQYPQATDVDLSHLVGVPGLIDVHVHLTYGLSRPPQGDAWGELRATAGPQRLVAGTRNAAATLRTGVTSVRNLFAFDSLDVYLRALIENDTVPGPRLFLSGSAIHPEALPPIPEGGARNPVEVLSEVARQRVAEGVDWLKIFVTTGSAEDLTAEQIFFYPEIRAATEIAHAGGLRVAVHSYGPSGVRDALRAGVDSLEHPVGLNDELIDLWADTDVVYVPTIDHNRYYADHREEYGYDETVERSLREFVAKNVETLRRAHRAGIRVAMGSDAVMTMFGQNTRELEWFVQAGLTPAEALTAATVNGAALLGQEQSLGRLKVGFGADIVAVDGDPLTDIRVLTRQVKWVMKAGRVVVHLGDD